MIITHRTRAKQSKLSQVGLHQIRVIGEKSHFGWQHLGVKNSPLQDSTTLNSSSVFIEIFANVFVHFWDFLYRDETRKNNTLHTVYRIDISMEPLHQLEKIYGITYRLPQLYIIETRAAESQSIGQETNLTSYTVYLCYRSLELGRWVMVRSICQNIQLTVVWVDVMLLL